VGVFYLKVRDTEAMLTCGKLGDPLLNVTEQDL